MIIASLLDKERMISHPKFNRWLIPSAALAIHLCIGQVYALSVFNLPMTKLIGITQSAPGDWNLPTLGWIFSLAIAFLGISAALFGKWVLCFGFRSLSASNRISLSRLRCFRWNRFGDWLYFSSFHLD